MRSTWARRAARRMAAVLTTAALGAALLPTVATAAGPSWYRVGSAAGSYRALASAPTTASFATTVAHGSATGTFRFDPLGTVSAPTGGPGQSPTGQGWATTTLDGTIAAGTWAFGATIDTTVPSGVAVGRLAVAVYAVGGSGSRLLAVVQSSSNVLATSGTRSVELLEDLPTLSFAGQRLATEWYLVVSSNGAPGSATTTLRHGAAGDHVTPPAALTPPPLQPPSNLRVTGTGDNTIALAWSASPDGRVTSYTVRRATAATGPWSDVATVGGTSYTDGGLSNGTRYYHTVVARSASGTSSPSNSVSAVPADVTAPSSPGDPSVSPNGSGRLDVVWSPSGSPDVASYEVQRSGSSTGPFAAIARVGGTSFSDTGLAAASTWHYRVVAIDDDGLRSAPTASAAGTVAPSPPTGLRVAGVASGAVALAWNGTSEPVTGYLIERAGSSGGPYRQIAGPIGGTSFTDGGLTNGVTYWYRVRAVDAQGASSSPSGAVSATPVDTGRPAPPTFLVKTPQGSRVRFDWGRSPSSSVVGYRVLRSRTTGGGYADISGLRNTTSFTDGPLPVAVPFYYVVIAEDAAGNRSIPSTEERYTVPPSAPTNLRASNITENTVTLTWNGTSEPIDGWVVSRRQLGGSYTVVGRASGPSFVDGSIELGRTYTYVVQAEATDGTLSPPSNEVTVVPRDGPPSAPTGLQASDTGAGGQVRVVWAANPEPDVVAYRIERSTGGAWTRLATLGTTTYLDGGLTDGVTYRYRVFAVDRVGNVSPPSGEAAAVPSDATPPPPPASVVVRSWPTYLDIAWTQSPGATSYRVYRSTSPGGPYSPISGTISNRTFRDAGVTPGTTYFYVVHAFDAAGNDSGPSQSAGTTFVGSSGVVGGMPGTGGGGGPGGAPGGGTGGIPGFSPGGPVAGGPTSRPTFPGLPGFGSGLDPDEVGGGQPGDGPTGPPTLAIGEIPPQAVATDQPDLPPGSRADEALAQGDLPGAIARSAEEVAENVGEVVRVFRIPLILLVLLLIYLVMQGRIGRETLPASGDVMTGGEDDDAEYLL